jgi:hypothetical protein
VGLPSEPFPDLPGVHVTTLSYVMSLMPPSIVKDLRLAAFGYRVVPMASSYAPQPGSGGIRHDKGKGDRFRETLSRFSTTDADVYEDWSAWLKRSATFLGPLLMETPPPIGRWCREISWTRCASRFGIGQAWVPVSPPTSPSSSR